ncbi:MAG: alpha-L-fucosidase [Bacteroidales bacterium]|nr:alpha-L-fucosidase [Bacteroidales bacterium]
MKKTLSLISAAIICCTSVFAQKTYTPTPENIKAREDFQDKKFGIFLHWGISSMLADGEWVQYHRNLNYKEYGELARGFYPSKFNAEEWVLAFKNAGAKYVTITSRHHDGFSMFGTKASPYNIVDATPFGRDILKELSEACAKHGLGLHLYYSHLDWAREDYPRGTSSPDFGRPVETQSYDSYFKFMMTQLRELLTNYGPIGAMWFDGVFDHRRDNPPFEWRFPEQFDLVHSLQPTCLIANNHHHDLDYGEDFQIFERDLPGQNTAGLSAGQKVDLTVPLEMCNTMNGSWGYKITDKAYKSTETLIQTLVKAAGMNTNLMLNIGPRPDGTLPEEALQRLAEIGKWMDKYGDTIYGTRGGIIGPHPWGVTTQKDGRLFVHIMSLQDKALFLPLDKDVKVKKAIVFGEGTPVTVTKLKEGGVILGLPKVPEGPDYIVELSI